MHSCSSLRWCLLTYMSAALRVYMYVVPLSAASRYSHCVGGVQIHDRHTCVQLQMACGGFRLGKEESEPAKEILPIIGCPSPAWDVLGLLNCRNVFL